MAYELAILDEAAREFDSIVAYLSQTLNSPQAAKNFMDEFDRQMQLVADMPQIFAVSKMPELAARGYRCAHVNNYVALYKISGAAVYIAHIFHQSQNYAKYV
jgi:plasmid stabilization system protein ParE